ncbi:MAG: glycosyltransferase family 39 protein [Deltaproteobacteria bacterium]|nr:glycosyltransferase family 39 protein [Deltaproteobacteria bacterium]
MIPGPDSTVTASTNRRREALILAAIVVVGLSVRLVFLAGWAETPLYHVPYGDEANFHQTALALIGQAGEADAFLYQPLYSFYLAGVYSVFGVDPAFVRTLQLFIALLTLLLSYGLGRELAGPWGGRWSALGMALYGPLIFFEGHLLAPGLVTPLLLGTLWALLRAGKGQRAWLLLPAGVLLGLAVMGRPNLLLLLPVGGLWWLVVARSWSRKGLGVALALAGLIVGLAPSWIHNARQGNPWSPVSSAGGISFFLGNNSQADGRFHVPKGMRIDATSHEAYRNSLQALAERARGRKLSPKEVSDYWYSEGFGFWSEDPLSALTLVGKKALMAVNTEEMAIHYPYFVGAAIVPLLGFLFKFGLVFAFAVMGIVLTLRRSIGVVLLASCAATIFLSLMAFYVADRYRISMIPMLMPLAAVGVVELAHLVRERRARDLWPWFGLLAFSFFLTQVPMVGPSAKQRAFVGIYNLMGRAEGEQGHLGEAERWFRKGIDLAGSDGGSVPRGNMGLLAEKRGHVDQARMWYLQVTKQDSEDRFVRLRLALLAESRGDLAEALRWWRELSGLEADPSRALARVRFLESRIESQTGFPN